MRPPKINFRFLFLFYTLKTLKGKNVHFFNDYKVKKKNTKINKNTRNYLTFTPKFTLSKTPIPHGSPIVVY